MSASHLKTFDLVGKKEDVSDYISLITPSDTPFQSSIGTEKISQTLHVWLEDQLRAVASNAKLEGHDFTDSTRDQPATRNNVTQILSETFKVSRTADVVKLYGRKKASIREMMKTGKLLKMDLEHALVGTGQTAVTPAEATAGQFAGVQAQIHANTTTTNGPAAALSEANIVDTHEKLYNEGSDATILMIKPSDSKVVSAFAQASERTRDMGDSKKVTNVVNVYESPFGTVRVVKNRRLRAQNALLYSPDNWKLLVLDPWSTEKLAKTSDAERWAMVGEFSLKHMNQKASGLIAGLL